MSYIVKNLRARAHKTTFKDVSNFNSVDIVVKVGHEEAKFVCNTPPVVRPLEVLDKDPIVNIMRRKVENRLSYHASRLGDIHIPFRFR